MTFSVQVRCLICRKLADPTITINSEKESNAKACNLLHNKLCLALKLEFSPEFQEWDFTDEPFPYCESCGQRLQRLGELIDQLKSIQEEISGSLATVSALVIASDKSDTSSSSIDPLILANKSCQAKDYHRSRWLKAKHNFFRSLIIQRFDPRVIVERYDDSHSYPGLADENYEYELVPTNAVIKTEPAIEGFPGSADEESILAQTEYKVDTSTIDTSNVNPETIIGLEETWASGTAASALSLALNPVENPATTPFSSTKDPGESIQFMKFDVSFDEASKTYELNGFKFQEIQTGSYECRTCGHVSNTAKGGQPSNTKYRMIRHIKALHLGVSRSLQKSISKRNVTSHELSKTYEMSGFKFKAIQNGYECCTCGTVSPLPKGKSWKQFNIRRHIQTTHMGIPRNDRRVGSWACEKCGEVCTTMQKLYTHRATAHPSLQCGHCGAKFAFKWHLKRHVMTHSEQRERPYSCDQCDQSFFSKLHLRFHSGVHTNERPEKCSRCNATYKTRHALQKHIRMVHRKKDEPELSVIEESGIKVDPDAVCA